MQLLGFESFAEFNLAPTMAASPDVVNSFLLELSGKLRDKADEVLFVLLLFALMHPFCNDMFGVS